MATATLAATFHTRTSEPQPTLRQRILVIESDAALRLALQRLFFSEGYDVEVVPDSLGAFESLRQRAPDAVILSLPRPGSSGAVLCQEIVKSIPGLPLIVLSGSSDVTDKVLLLELGADDYVTLPFSPKELVARLRAQIRRVSRPPCLGMCVFEDVTLDFSKTEVTRAGQEIIVTALEFKTLKFFAQNPQRVVSRDELLDKVWGYENYPCTRTVDNLILRLRQKLESDPSRPSHFLTVHGLGYKFVP